MGISVPIILTMGQSHIDLLAKLVTGAPFCVFEREVGEALSLEIEQGRVEWIGTSTDRFNAYGHDITLQALGLQFDLTAYFTEMFAFGRNVLGRYGWMQQVIHGLVDSEAKLYVGRYGDEIVCSPMSMVVG
jgi:hypothetical protein